MVETTDGSRSALGRVLRTAGGEQLLEALASLSGTDLTTLQLELMRRRAAEVSPARVLERYRTDRFTVAATVPFPRLRRAEQLTVAARALLALGAHGVQVRLTVLDPGFDDVATAASSAGPGSCSATARSACSSAGSASTGLRC
ncbi:hypothetical protein [Jiangella asiatica]|uniref:Uncharacterized protein n=1 Tax=Jiangella asiatica TaxID=2530372 RepID=A0A4R5DT42_9ACTN|nr:hypothetical protein [Jiangella asiatica]TDE14053.1 hypothetical protein E1269_04720 [Jiangella asiatica]